MRNRPVLDPVESAIAQHLQIVGELMAAQRGVGDSRTTNNVEIITRLDKILAKLGTPAEHPVRWVKLEKYVELTGDSVDAVNGRRKLGKWLMGNQYKIVDGRVWVDLRAAQRWVEEWDARSPMLEAGRPTSKKPKK